MQTETLIHFAIFMVIYLIPFNIALNRKHHQLLAILATNVLLGWTVIGWIVALIWACTAVRPDLQHKSQQ